MKWHELNKTKSTESKAEYTARVKYQSIVTKSANSFMDIVGNDLTEGIQYRIVTNNSFNAISVYEYLSKQEEITELHIAIYRMNERAVTYLKTIIDTNKIKAQIIISSFFRENKKYETWCKNLVAYSSKSELCKVGFSWNHAKVFLAKTESGKYIVFEGSGNLSDNARIEQYIIENNKQVYLFHKKWITDLINLPTNEKSNI